MEWIETESSFKYNGKSVTRHKVLFKTPFGEFTVYEAVNGKIFVRHPFLKYWYSVPGFDGGSEEFFGLPKIAVASLEVGKILLEKKWEQVQSAVNAV